MAQYFEELEHTADWTVRAWGDDVEALFEHAAAAMFELQGADTSAEPLLQDEVHVTGVDLEALLVAWLNELLFASEMNDALYTRFAVRITEVAGVQDEEPDLALYAQIKGLPGRGHLAHVKAVTYYNLAVRQSAAGWEATVTFDT